MKYKKSILCSLGIFSLALSMFNAQLLSVRASGVDKAATAEVAGSEATAEASTAAATEESAASDGGDSGDAAYGPHLFLNNTANTNNQQAIGPHLGASKSADTNLAASMREHRLSKTSKYFNYVWKDGINEVPDTKVYVYEPKSFNGKTVFLDAGHGDNSHPATSLRTEKSYPVPDSMLAGMNTSSVGEKAYDRGVTVRSFPNVYDNKEIEPEFTLRIALLTRDKLLEKGYRVVLSRNDFNQNISNGARAILASETSDIFISIHSNASVTKRASGTLALYPGDIDYLSGKTYPNYTGIMGINNIVAQSRRLAELMTSNISASTGLPNTGAKSAVLRIFSYSSIPTCLIEVGFSDHPYDAKILIEKKEEISNSIVKGIDEYFSN